MRTLFCTTALLVFGAAATPNGGCSHEQQPTFAANEPTQITWHRQVTSIPAYTAGSNYEVVYTPKYSVDR